MKIYKKAGCLLALLTVIPGVFAGTAGFAENQATNRASVVSTPEFAEFFQDLKNTLMGYEIGSGQRPKNYLAQKFWDMLINAIRQGNVADARVLSTMASYNLWGVESNGTYPFQDWFMHGGTREEQETRRRESAELRDFRKSSSEGKFDVPVKPVEK